jgi:hypothetical protein
MPSHERWNSKFQIKGGTWVFVPTEETIEKGLLLKKLIEDRWSAPNYYYHLRRGGHIGALRKHLKNRYFIHLDIKNFFGQINRSRITRSLKEHFSYEIARDIAIDSTVRLPDSSTAKYILPFGFVQSPIIASVCLSKSALGRHLSQLARRKGFVVSVYMDDILLSGENAEELELQMVLIKAASEKSGLPLHPTSKEGAEESITAFNICISENSLEITPSRFKELVDAFANSTNPHQRAGILNYVLSVNQDQADFLLKA